MSPQDAPEREAAAAETKSQRSAAELEEHAVRVRHTVTAIGREAAMTRAAAAEVDRHLREERVLFSKLGGVMARVFAHLEAAGGGALDEEGAALRRNVGELLTMGRWRGEEVLKKVGPLGRAALAVQEAAREAEKEVGHGAGGLREQNGNAGGHTGAAVRKPPKGVPSAKRTAREAAPATAMVRRRSESRE